MAKYEIGLKIDSGALQRYSRKVYNMKKKIKDCTVQELFDMCNSVNCPECKFDKYALIPEEGGCPIYTLMSYENKNEKIELPEKEYKE